MEVKLPSQDIEGEVKKKPKMKKAMGNLKAVEQVKAFFKEVLNTDEDAKKERDNQTRIEEFQRLANV